MKAGNFLSCHYFNARSLSNKLSDLNFLLESLEYDVICVTETWGTSLIPDSLFLNGSFYSIVRCDRPGRYGGGVCIFIKSSLKFKSVTILPIPNIDIVCIDLLGFDIKYRFINCYVPLDLVQ